VLVFVFLFFYRAMGPPTNQSIDRSGFFYAPHQSEAYIGLMTNQQTTRHHHHNTPSHQQVVARGMGKCCVTGCHSLHVDYDNKTFTTTDGKAIKQGDIISLDGATGEVSGQGQQWG
jgi:phosphoenolpyruvate synthase/pyruvate phosphate dikinase